MRVARSLEVGPQCWVRAQFPVRGPVSTGTQLRVPVLLGIYRLETRGQPAMAHIKSGPPTAPCFRNYS